MKLARCWPALLAAACRVGGPSGDPDAYVEFPSDAADAGADSAAAESGGEDAFEIDATTDASSSGEASSEATATTDAGGADVACTPPSVSGCNPVTGMGCTLSQCDIDTTQMTPTGTCVIGSPFPNDAGNPCTQVSGSVSCQPQFTCYGGSCQKVCFCNADCGSNTCCSGRAGTTGFGLCGPCH